MTAAVRGLEGSRTILRRRALPSGRAVAGGFLMALAALGVFVAARGAGARPTQNYVVVAHEVIAGTTLTDDDLTFAALDLPGSLASHAFTSRSSVVGQVAIAHLSAGDLVQSSVVVAGDRVVLGDWNCDGTPTAAIARPSTGAVYVFDKWPAAGVAASVHPVGTVAGVVDLRVEPRGDCAALFAVDADGSESEVM
jgi:hypothetical protein